MNINHIVNLNLSDAALTPTIHMTQGDTNSRIIKASLWDGAQPFSIPANSVVMVRFGKPDGTGGLYDHTESNEAVTFSGSTVTAPVAAQMLSVSGIVKAEIDLYGGAVETPVKLATFPFRIEVKKSAYDDDAIISSDYYNILTDSIRKAIEAGRVVEELSIHPAKIGDNGNWYTWDAETNAYVDSGTPARGPSGHMIHNYSLPEGGPSGSYIIMSFSSTYPMPEDWALDDYILNDYGDMFVISKITPKDDEYEVRFDFVVNLKGPQGDSPTIGSNGHWWVGTTDTGVVARGDTGPQGTAPHIGGNGHWWIGTVDTGINAKGDKGDGLKIDGSVPTYADLPMLTAADMGTTYLVDADGRLYFWSGTAWPASGQGLLIMGEDGVTPHIGANGHWWIGTTDTGTNAQGEAGTQGPPGTDGKSAYEAAQDGGYTGTEAAFNAALAHESVSATATLTAAGWSNGVQTLAFSDVTAAANGSLRIAQSATDEQFEAWGAAKPRVTAQTAGTLTVKAVGTVPTVDIPVEVIIV